MNHRAVDPMLYYRDPVISLEGAERLLRNDPNEMLGYIEPEDSAAVIVELLKAVHMARIHMMGAETLKKACFDAYDKLLTLAARERVRQDEEAEYERLVSERT